MRIPSPAVGSAHFIASALRQGVCVRLLTLALARPQADNPSTDMNFAAKVDFLAKSQCFCSSRANRFPTVNLKKTPMP